jgi:subtilisin family serine protease
LSKRCVLLLVALCVGMAACASANRGAAEPIPDPGSTAHQILVMLGLAPPHFRPDAGYAESYDSRFGREGRRRVAEQLANAYMLKLIADWPMPALGVDCFVMEVDHNDSVAHLAEQLSQDPQVESAQPMNVFHVLGHNDPLYPLQPSARLWRLAEMHEITTGKDVLVAEIDTGVDLEHPDLHGQVTLVRNFVDGSDYVAETHGTAVAGIIVAHADNGIGIAGVAPQARLMALRACWQQGGDDRSAFCNSFTVAKALQFAIDQNARVINLSLGGPRDRLLERLMEVGLARGISIVSAVDSRVTGGGFPASYAGVLAVAGDGENDVPRDVLQAPGKDIPTTTPGGRWSFVAGSSFAAAHVTGVVALLQELVPDIQPSQVRDTLTPPGTSGMAATRPAMIDARAAIGRAAATCRCAVTSVARSLPPG